jgi:M6 family metalloprotease-like protein
MRHPARLPALFLTSVLLLLTLAPSAWAHHPLDGEIMQLKQPDGSRVSVRVWGDSWYARLETLDGYTVVRDEATGALCYARLSDDGQRFESTGAVAGAPVPPGIEPGLELPLDVRRDLRETQRKFFLREEQSMFLDKADGPQPSNQGEVRGLTLIIDFSDEPGTVPAANFDAYLNEQGYTGYGNNGSVRDYFYDVSGGALDYTNYVPAQYIRAPQPKSYYEDPDVQHGYRARELVVWACNWLDDQGHDFSQYDANGDGYIDAINVFYAGYPDGGWAVGLWPHSWVMSFYADGVSSYKYQITNIGSSLRLSTFCHENGHMIMFWPDLYDYGYESSGVGGFCLMCSSGAGTNPVRPCAYLRAEAGWETPVQLQGLQTDLPVSHDDMNIYKVPHPTQSNEYYLVENRQRTGRDASLPANGGLAIWHVDEYGSNNDEQQTPSQHYLVTLVQADGRWDLENDANNGDSTDLWFSPSFTQFDPTTSPAATWWDGGDAPIYIDNVSASATVMTFDFREALGTMSVTVQPQPEGLLAPWTLTGPGDYLLEGEGYASILVWDEGTYTLTWGDLPGWSEPDPLVESSLIVDGGAPVLFEGTYGDPPFTVVAAGPAGDAGAARAVALVDHDGDGDCDLHLINDGTSDRLLRNDGGFAFTDVTPTGLDDSGAGRGAAWADYDGDGDLDVFLARAGQANRLFEADGAGFTEVTSLSYGLDDAGPGADAQWVDFDGDGLLDLYLVQAGAENVLYRNFGDLGSGHPLLLEASHPLVENTGDGSTATWIDHDNDGDADVYLVNRESANRLVSNYQGVGFDDANQPTLATTADSRDATWGDFDNDGDWDVYVVNDGAPDAMYMKVFDYYQTLNSPVTADDGDGVSVTAADFDNDGVLDLYVARRGADDLLIFGDGEGGFQRASLGLTETAGACEVAVCADLDGDGGVDVYVARDGEPNLLLRNTIQGRGHWLGLRLEAAGSGSAIGASVRVVTAAGSQRRYVQAGSGRGETAPTLHVGLGAWAAADTVEVIWPDGEVTTHTALAGDATVTLRQEEDATPVADELPNVTRLHAAYPNPFNPSTTIAFDLARSGRVRLDVYGLDGRLVRRLINDDRPAGHHQTVWDGRDRTGRAVASGTYLCRLRTTDQLAIQRLTLVK